MSLGMSFTMSLVLTLINLSFVSEFLRGGFLGVFGRVCREFSYISCDNSVS
ncbi:MAG: DUF2798 domain-containing protein [Candidatus Bathyarchaeales archaeon]